MRPEILQELLARAQGEPLGMVIQTDNPKALIQQFWKAGSSNFPKIQVSLPSWENYVFIVHKSVELD